MEPLKPSTVVIDLCDMSSDEESDDNREEKADIFFIKQEVSTEDLSNIQEKTEIPITTLHLVTQPNSSDILPNNGNLENSEFESTIRRSNGELFAESSPSIDNLRVTHAEDCDNAETILSILTENPKELEFERTLCLL